MEQRATDLAAKVSSGAELMAYSTATGTVIFGLTWGECAAIVGIIATLVTSAVSIYCKFRHLRLAEKRAAHDGILAKEADDDDE